MSIAGALKMGKFSSDRTINEYAADIWDIERVKIPAPSSSALTRVRSQPNLKPAEDRLKDRRTEITLNEANILGEITDEFLENSLIEGVDEENLEVS